MIFVQNRWRRRLCATVKWWNSGYFARNKINLNENRWKILINCIIKRFDEVPIASLIFISFENVSTPKWTWNTKFISERLLRPHRNSLNSLFMNKFSNMRNYTETIIINEILFNIFIIFSRSFFQNLLELLSIFDFVIVSKVYEAA